MNIFRFSSPKKRVKNANNVTYYVKLGKKRRKSFQTALLHYFSKSDNKSDRHRSKSSVKSGAADQPNEGMESSFF